MGVGTRRAWVLAHGRRLAPQGSGGGSGDELQQPECRGGVVGVGQAGEEGAQLAALQQQHREDQARVEAIRREMARVLG
jgi:hypothetical protein